ncbi:MAG: PepSY domain-containing protein [Pseudomonadales bacterium]|nr:PepSY domain-containing protein [Pseudomonadales bacterium]
MVRLIILCFMLSQLAIAPGISADMKRGDRSSKGMKHIFRTSQKVRMGNQQAARKAKRNFPGNKILGVKLMQSGGPPVYRIKMLSAKGIVKFVFVDAVNGEVIK